MSTIGLEALTKVFGDLTAVDAINLDVSAGEVVCLLGPSGCGKTTTLRMVAGLEEATGGEIRLAGERVNDRTARQRNVAMVFQFYALYPSITVYDNLSFPLHAERLKRPEIDARVRRVSAMLQLEHVLERRPAQLAEGEKQRVAVARAIVREPACFLFDEPLSRLDVQLRETMRGQIKEVLTGLNRATVIVTHDQLEALTMADRIAVMRDGVIEQVDTPHAVFSTPSNLFVAGFIGSPQMNLVSAQCQSCESGLATFRIGDQAMRIRVNPAVDRLAGTQVTLGIRPRSVELADEGSSADFQATVDLIEPMGAETLAHLVDGERDLRVVFDHRVRLAEGERVRIRFREGQTHVFDAGGQRVGS